MKPLYIVTIAALCCTTASRATVHTVNNNTPSPGMYTSFAAAQTAASPGDTIYFTGSSVNYNSITISKQLVLIGTGHKPQSSNPSVSRLDDISFAGAAGDVAGTKIIGLDVSVVTLSITSMTDIEIARCKIRSQLYIGSSLNNTVIEGNWFEGTGYNLNTSTGGFIYNNVTFKNNIFNGRIDYFYPSGSSSNIYFNNNIFLYNGTLVSSNMRFCTFNNNIFYRTSVNTGFTGIYFNNNITYHPGGTPLPIQVASNVLNGNLEDTDPDFTAPPAPGAYYEYTQDYSLQPGSPAINAGSDGKDIGITGGDGYFQKYGIPAIPQIRDFKIVTPADATIAPGGTLNISVSSTIKK